MPFINSVRGNFSAIGRSSSYWAPVIATGGTESTITVDGVQFKVHQFTSGTSNFVVSSRGTDGIVEALIVGGGGGGGFGHGGGGAGGAVLHRTNQPVTATTYSISVGNGASGNGSNAANNSGGSSSAFGVTATGGGSGANESGDDTSGRGGAGGAGANGGGGTYGFAPGGTGTAPSASGWTVYAGYNGGAGGTAGQPAYLSGGGGGAGGAGKSPIETAYGAVTSRAGRGADGIFIPITGNNYFWGAGGGGVSFGYSAGTHYAGNGGAGGGGASSAFGSTGTNVAGIAIQGGAINNGGNGVVANDGTGGAGGANTGAGGGAGANENGTGGAGGSGIVVIRYPLSNPAGLYPKAPTPGLVAGMDSGSMVGGSPWFNASVPYYGVDNSETCRLAAGEAVNRFQWRDDLTTSNTAIWFVVFEQISTYNYAICAAWQFTGIAASAGNIKTRNTSAAAQSLGMINKNNNNIFVTPSGATFGTGNYYMGWVSADTRANASGGVGIYVNSSTGGTIDYVTVVNAGGYPDILGTGYRIDFTDGRDTGTGLHMNFSYV